MLSEVIQPQPHHRQCTSVLQPQAPQLLLSISQVHLPQNPMYITVLPLHPTHQLPPSTRTPSHPHPIMLTVMQLAIHQPLSTSCQRPLPIPHLAQLSRCIMAAPQLLRYQQRWHQCYTPHQVLLFRSPTNHHPLHLASHTPPQHPSHLQNPPSPHMPSPSTVLLYTSLHRLLVIISSTSSTRPAPTPLAL